ncbi:MAG: RIP metalloprotease RseP [Gemmatimonadota bacterium]
METFLTTLLLLGVLIFVHELGHFLAAKWAGIGVPRFSLGLGPRLVGFRIGETDYCLSAIPFGGYVKMAGTEGDEVGEWVEGDRAGHPPGDGEGHEREEVAGFWVPDAGAEEPEDALRRGRERSAGFDTKPLWVRLIVILAGVTMNFVFGFVVFVWLSWSQGEPLVPTTLGSVDPELVRLDPELEAWRGRTVQAVNGEEVSTWDELLTRLEGAAAGEPLRVRFAGAGEDAVDRAVSPSSLAAGLAPAFAPVVGRVQDGGPAARARIRPGDRILELDGRPVTIWEDVPDYVRKRAGERILVRVERDATPGERGGERTLDLTVVPARERAPGADNKFVEVGFLGVSARLDVRPIGLGEAVQQGTQATLRAGGLIMEGLGQLVTGQVSFDSIGGPVAIGQITGYYQRQGFEQLLWWMGLFSINLAILNLLPIPVLDGGHVVFFLLPEAVRGRPLSLQLKTRIALAGWVMVGLLMAWAVTSDITRLIGF